MSSVYISEHQLPLSIRIVGRMYAFAYATRAVVFSAFVWMVPSYDIQTPPLVTVKVKSPRSRSSSRSDTACTAVSGLSTSTFTAASELSSSSLSENLFTSPAIIGEKGGDVAVAEEMGVKPKSIRMNGIMSRLVSSLTPVARYFATPRRRLSFSVSNGVYPRRVVTVAQKKCTSLVSGVNSHLPRHIPSIRSSVSMNVLAVKAASSALTTSMKKITSPVKNSVTLKKVPRRQTCNS
ncbi:hypothetical protein AMATHDRAFT_2281 [Amanita thiersii Skay4041]|uniref:Uncharacterized protein n=1 Tax=Amanita thiersii Skay4041 TaxID=703135 RepID=A0A2A9NWQ6_9AGAR|nr:hypothetical protein AMATHDRAFT_2281 [Amanita thiersii Skay4041]